MYHLKKSLGQHFLKNETDISKIIAVLNDLNPASLLEVGPGAGALTRHIIGNKAVNFKAVEIDKEKVDFLQSKFPDLQIIEGDFLAMSPPFDTAFSVIGNFPYNISSQILFKILDWFPAVENVIGMFQREVAKRITSGPGNRDYGILSVLIQYYYDPVYLFDVGRNSFIPPPKVESGVIRLKARKELLKVKSETHLKSLVKSSFAHRRKTLRNNLKGLLPEEKLKEPLFDRRAETLSVEEFAELTSLM